ncbi:pectate lyase plyB [Aspergillus nomiae NRRL 13137]|uniref:pectate lyase n=1 Tax=Aspergillus nomiae NRRL (strain ATCC 15546 / NRRL 13137 / CBS 260.88 / M93) TaxID=1509407 RepID=A0A0L1J7B2_ASPN3|nr:pectate lyase plyB [Aspergillus nomiae NRRL 13137]KNG87639.1 pectate lyase plyB [Aspergillus nomiae NRRL 13137]
MANFKLFLALAACLSGQALAAPTKTVAKRAAISDVSLPTTLVYCLPVLYLTCHAGCPRLRQPERWHQRWCRRYYHHRLLLRPVHRAVSSDDAKIVIVDGTITQEAKQVKVGSNTSIIGKDANAILEGFGLLVKEKENVIIRNLGVKKVLADNGDAIGVQYSNNVWIDHCDVSSDRDHDKDYYDGLIDLTHAADYVTISNTFVHDHWKAMLYGHSDSNGDEDTGHLRITVNNNYLNNLNSRGPSFRFGTGHIYNNYYLDGNVWEGGKKPLYSTDEGYAVARDNDFGDGENTAPEGTLTSVPYEYDLLAASAVKAAVYGTAGQTLTF